MSQENVIRNTLKNLESEDFSDFCDQLTEPMEKIRIMKSEVEGKSRSEIAKLLVKRCGETGALDRAITALKDIGCNNEAQKLESRYTPQSSNESSGVCEPVPELYNDLVNSVSKRSPKREVTLEVEKSSKSTLALPGPKVAMSAKAIIQRNKTSIQSILSGDHKLILNKVYENKLITQREYNNLKGIYKENVEGHIIELVDKVMDKGEERCQSFLDLLETDDDIKGTFPDLSSLQLSLSRPLAAPVQETCEIDNTDDESPRSKKKKMDEPYLVNSNPRGICLILNNVKFDDGGVRHGTNKDTESLAEVFSWLGFRVLMCEDKTQAEMSDVLLCFSTLCDTSKLQQWGLKEWSSPQGFDVLKQDPLKHGDVFICCILSHGEKGAVCGKDGNKLPIKDITRTFKTSNNSPLNGKPKVFLIQACQGKNYMPGVIEKDLATDEVCPVTVPEDADVLLAVATVEDYLAIRNTKTGSWFIQSLCQQLKEGCPRGDDVHSILQRVNRDVSLKEGITSAPGQIKQIPEIRYTLRKKLTLPLFNV